MLNELDQWIESNWEENPVVYEYLILKNGTKNGYKAMRSTKLKLKVAQEKTRIGAVKRRYSEFLGFKIKVHSKGTKKVVKSHISDKQLMTKKKVFINR